VTYNAEAMAASGSQEKTISNLKISDFKWRRRQKSRPREPHREADSAQDAGAAKERCRDEWRKSAGVTRCDGGAG
jgi:hypothetical protein